MILLPNHHLTIFNLFKKFINIHKTLFYYLIIILILIYLKIYKNIHNNYQNIILIFIYLFILKLIRTYKKILC